MRHLQRFFLILLTAIIVSLYFLHKNLQNQKQIYEKSNLQQLNFEQKTCGRFPEKKDISIDNVIWQILELKNGFVKILNAYLDTRQNKTVVRINVNSIDLKIERDNIFCQFWFEGSEEQPVVTQATEYVLMWFECKF